MKHKCLAICIGMTLILGVGYGAEDASQGLVLQLPFDGDYNPKVGTGTAQPFNNPQFVEGKLGQAVKLENTACLTVPVPDCVRQGEFTISFWLKPLWDLDDGVAHPILVIPNDPKKRDSIGWGPNDFFFSKGWSDLISPDNLYGIANAAASQLKRGEWAHVAIGFSVTNKVRADYINGQGGKCACNPMPLDCHGNQIWMGSHDNRLGGGDIVIDDFRVFNRLVDEKELPAIAGATFSSSGSTFVYLQEWDPARVVETPHVTWAKPYAGGKIKMLGISECFKTREFMELAQRMDMDLTVIGMQNLDSNTMNIKEQICERGRKIEAALKKDAYDVVIMSAYPWDLLAESTRAAIMEFVNKGGGLALVTPWCVLDGTKRNMGGVSASWADSTAGRKIEALVAPVQGEDANWLLDGIPWHEISMFIPELDRRSPASLFRTGKVGQGRILIYDLTQTTSYSDKQSLTPCFFRSVKGSPETGLTPILFDEFEYDYALGVAARAVLWAAGKTSPIRVRQLSYAKNNILDTSARLIVGGKGQWLVDIQNDSGKEVKAEVWLTIRSRGPDAPAVIKQDAVLKPGRNALALGYVIDRVGTIFGDAQVIVDNKVADWATMAVGVIAGTPYLGEVKADQELYTDQSPRITVSFAVFNWGSFCPGETGELKWRLYDGYDRLVERGVKTIQFNPWEVMDSDMFTLAPLSETCLGYTLVVEVGRNGTVTDQRRLFLRRYRDPMGDFRFTVWDGYSDPVISLASRVLRDQYQLDCAAMSRDYFCVDFGDLRDIAARLDWYNKHNLYSWIYAMHLGNGTKILDSAQARRIHDDMAAIGAVGATRNMYFYSLGDEVCQGNPGRNSDNLEQEDFRTQMRTKYKTLDTLNKLWNTQFTNWADMMIPLPPPAATNISRAPQPVVAEYRENLVSRSVAIGTEGVRSTDANARVGIEGMPSLMQAWPAGDLWSLAQSATFLGPYAIGMEQDMIRSFQKPGSLLGGWYNYAGLMRDYNLSGPWMFLLSGADTFQWYTIMGAEPSLCYSALNPDFSPYIQFAWTYEELGPILSGIGKLCKSAERDHLGVAILHNQRNLARGAPLWSTMQAYNLLKHIGVWPDFIHGEQIKAGDLAKRQVKVLWLPHQEAMEEDVAKEIRKFVETGGAVIADTEPAVNNMYRSYDKPLLTDLFVDPKIVKSPLLPETADEVAAWKDRVKTVGKGKTLFFAMGPGEMLPYRHDFWKPKRAGFRQVIAGFLKENGVAPQISAQAAEGDGEPLDIVTYHRGGSCYAAFQRNISARVQHPEPRAFDLVNASGKAHVYDVRAGKYLGESDRTRLTMECARGGMVAFLPYKAEGIEVKGLPEKCAPGAALKIHLMLKTTGALPESGIFRVACLDPKGNRVASLGGKVAWGIGGVTIPLTVAYNDPAGQWKLVVTDIATGTRLEKTFEVLKE